MQLTYLPWVIEVSNLENIVVDSPDAFCPEKIVLLPRSTQYSEVKIEPLVCVSSNGIMYS